MKSKPPQLHELLTQPVPKEVGRLKLSLLRKPGLLNKIFPTFYLYDRQETQMLVNAKKMYKNKTSNYHVTTIANEFEKTSAGYLGKLRGRL